MKVEGTITTDQGQAIGFFIDGNDGSSHQWGQPTGVLGRNVDLMEKLRDAVWAETNDQMGTADASG